MDALSYTRMLKAKGVTVIFEKENIDTSTMESGMQLSLLSALAQNEVESLSQNVSLGVQMKMSRGKLMGFNGCLDYMEWLRVKKNKQITLFSIYQRVG